jgi:predicted phosphodiesterase
MTTAHDTRIRVQVISDLHAEMSPHRLPAPAEVDTGADIVVMAGDMGRAMDSVGMTTALFPNAAVVVLVGGNHEHYGTGGDMDQGLAFMQDAARAESERSGRTILALEDHKALVKVRGAEVRLLGCTLWTDFALYGRPERDRTLVFNALNDYRMIRGVQDSDTPAGTGLSTAEVMRRHEASRSFLSAELGQHHGGGPTIVVTHHLPSMRSVAQRYKKDLVSAGFASNLDALVDQGASLWVHGHTHSSCRWRAPGGTLVVCNPAGYALRSGGRENGEFDPALVVDIRRGAPDGAWRAGVESPVILAEEVTGGHP